MTRGYFADFSHDGIYDRLTDDRLTPWYPVFRQLGDIWERCVRGLPPPLPGPPARWAAPGVAGLFALP